ncbi:MAG: fimbria major subunit [Muribaculaceae bacterium]|nr:fimbria major subunit [Muribaculaceae bacterium]
MKILYNIKFLFVGVILVTIMSVLISSCRDDILNGPTDDKYDPSKDPSMVVLPLSINMSVSASTRDDNYEYVEGEEEEEEEEPDPWGPGVSSGSKLEHRVDFDTENECFAIFFNGKNKIKYLQPITTTEQLGDGVERDDPDSEFGITAITYVKKKDIDKDKLDKDNGDTEDDLIHSVLVVLNGGKIYKTIRDKALELCPQLENEEWDGKYTDDNNKDHIDEIRNLTWNLGWEPIIDTSTGTIRYKNDDGTRIGFNSKGYFTMTNSSYYEKVKDETTDVENLVEVKAAKVTQGVYYNSISDYIKRDPETRKASAKVYVERMVAKFSAPTFRAEVIGADLVFRPDLNALPLVVYSWDGETLKSEQKNWRIHLTGWTINGEESSSFIFKKIPGSTWNTTATGDQEWAWNQEGAHRTYWGIDPHYGDLEKEFYPWQYRKAADVEATVSMQTALTRNMWPSLYYNTFNTIHGNWSNETYSAENTFDPTVLIPYSASVLDGRASYLAGPHLILTGELFLQEDGGTDYVSNGVGFTRVEHIYSDRIRRYFRSEKDWVKMFVREFNRSLVAQEKMSFHVYDWDENNSGKANHTYVTTPSGECKLFLRQKAEIYEIFDETVETLDGIGEKDAGYKFTPVTLKMIDKLAATPGVTLSALANVRNGDGRLIPWVENVNAPGDSDDERWENFGFVVRNPSGGRLEFDYEKESDGHVKDKYDWSYDMYKSLFFEWFGPIDHYYKGYMYYAGDISNIRVGNVPYFGAVRNHWYKFHVESINSLGVPVDNPDQMIIPGNYNYRDQIIVYLDIIDWHPKQTEVGL